MLLSETIELYMDYCYSLAERTRFLYRQHLTRLAKELGDPPLDQITRRTLTHFMAGLKQLNGKPYSPGYKSQIWRTLHTFFEYCVLDELLSINPMKRVPKPKNKTGAKPRLSLNQIKQLLEAIDHTSLKERNRVIVLLMVDSGLRPHEVVNLKVNDVFLEEKTLYIRDDKNHTNRYVPMRAALIQAIEDYLDVRRPAKNRDEALLLKRDGQPITQNASEQVIKRLKGKLDFKLWPYLLRHTFANIYNSKGNTRKLQKILGHSSIETTARFYTDPDYKDIQEEHDQVAPSAQIGL